MLSTLLLFGATANAQDVSTISKDEILTEVASLKANYDSANAYVGNEANWANNEMVGLANYLKSDFWRFFEWGVAFQGTAIDTWFPLLNVNVESAIASNVTMEALWDEYVAIPSGGALPESSQIDSRFFETKKGHKGKGPNKGPKGHDKVDWGKCKKMEPTSTDFEAECGTKMKEFKKESKWDCRCKNATEPTQSASARQDKPESGKPEGGKPEGGKPEGGKPEGGRPQGSRPEGGRPEGHKPGEGHSHGAGNKGSHQHKEGGHKGKYALEDSGKWDKKKWEEWDQADYKTKFNTTDGGKPPRFFGGKGGKMFKKECDCKPKPQTRHDHGGEDSFFKGPKKPKNFEPITADEFKQKVQGKISERAASVATCDASLDTIPDEKWTKFEEAASDERELKMTLKLLHFCTHGGKKAKEMVDEVAKEVDDAGSANEVNDADLSERIELLEREIVCGDDDLFCNANSDVGGINGSGFEIMITSLALFLFSLIL